MAETIVEDGKQKCQGTIKKGGLSGKECRRTLLIKHPELGWSIPCDRCPEVHPLLNILRDLVERGGLDEKEREDLATVLKERGKNMSLSETHAEDRKKLMEAFDFVTHHGFLFEAGNLKGVIFHFSCLDESDVEIDKVNDRYRAGCILCTYVPNEKIQCRLKKELPCKIVFIFQKHGVQLVLNY